MSLVTHERTSHRGAFDFLLVMLGYGFVIIFLHYLFGEARWGKNIHLRLNHSTFPFDIVFSVPCMSTSINTIPFHSVQSHTGDLHILLAWIQAKLIGSNEILCIYQRGKWIFERRKFAPNDLVYLFWYSKSPTKIIYDDMPQLWILLICYFCYFVNSPRMAGVACASNIENCWKSFM